MRHLSWSGVNAIGVQCVYCWQISKRCGAGFASAIHTLTHPLQHTGILPKTRPDESPFSICLEPIGVEDLGCKIAKLFAEVHPVSKVISHIVATEWQHSKWITAHSTNGALCCSRQLRADDGSHEHTMLPAESFRHQWHQVRAATSKQNGTDGHTLRILPLRIDHRALRCRRRVPCIRVCSLATTVWGPRLASPINQAFGGGLGHALPPHITIWGQRNVCEDGVLLQRLHCTQVGLVRCAWCHPKEPRLRVDGIQPAILSHVHPGDVISHTTHLPAGNGRNQHCKIGLATGTREGCNNVVFLALW
mmetsp:Transcript_93186/g.156578  ORF Transcript_93186/g.156578 Transcript_93186/m.156578 type:complete len:305 (+) Transcript_93186:1140-2054(+)